MARSYTIATHYHEVKANPVDWKPFEEMAKRFESPFFTMDIALTETGDWIIVDMGAGECSSFPPSLDPTEFYRKLKASLHS